MSTNTLQSISEQAFRISSRETGTVASTESTSTTAIRSGEVIPLSRYSRQSHREKPHVTGWQQAIVASICEYLALPEGWDSYKGRPIRPETGMFAIQLLNDLMKSNTPTPQVVPVSTGGIQFEWHLAGYDLEIYVAAPYECEVSYDDRTGGQSDDFPVEIDFSPLVRLFDRLTPPIALPHVG